MLQWMQNINSFCNAQLYKLVRKMDLHEHKASGQKIFNVLWAILFGLIIGGIILAFSGENLFTIYAAFINGSFQSNQLVRNFLISTLIYVFVAIGIGVGFKVGLFNIGASGQMMLAGLLAVLYLLKVQSSSDGHLLVALLISVGSGFVLAVVPGLLKVWLQVNEVVSTILINWMVFYFGKYITTLDDIKSPLTTFSTINIPTLPDFYSSLSYGVIAFLMGVGFGLLIWWLLRKTTLGLQIRMVGASASAAQYSGVNQKILTMLVLGFSGALSGIGGYLFYVIKTNNYASGLGPLLNGFNAIAISLIAYNSPIGIVFSSMFYSMFESGSGELSSLSSNFNSDTYNIILGVIIYLVAICVVFDRFKPISWIINYWGLLRSKRFFGAVESSQYYKLKQSFIKQWYGLKNDSSQQKPAKQIAILEQYAQNLLTSLQNKTHINDLQKIYWTLRWINGKLIRLHHQHLKPQIKAQTKTLQQLKRQLQNNWTEYLLINNNQQKEIFFEQLVTKQRTIQTQIDALVFNDYKAIQSRLKNQRNQFRAIYHNHKNNLITIYRHYLSVLLYYRLTVFYKKTLYGHKYHQLLVDHYRQLQALNYQNVFNFDVQKLERMLEISSSYNDHKQGN